MRYFLFVLFLLNSISWAEHVTPSSVPNDPSKQRPVAEPVRSAPQPMTMEEAMGKGISNLLLDPKTHELLSPTGKPFKISVLTEEQVNQIFSEMAEQKHIPFCYPEDGCYARAHEMTRLMEKKGIIAGKVFLEGDLRVETKNSPKGFVEWWYHVAPLVAVRKGDETEMMVIDPSLAIKPVSLEAWEKLQTSHSSGKRDKLYQTQRFTYLPSDKKSQYSSYQDEDIKDTQTTMQRFRKVLSERIEKK